MKVSAIIRDKVVMWSTPSPLGVEIPWQRELASWPADLRDAFEERAAIIEFEGGLSRAMAEQQAYEITREATGAATSMPGRAQ